MSHSNDSDLGFPSELADSPRFRAPPKMVVRLAAVVIIWLALAGLIRGAISMRGAAPSASPLAVLTGLSPAASAAAKPAVILPRDDAWSTLSGPRMIDASERPKAAPKPVESDDEEDDSASPAAATAAADAIAPDAPDAPPAAQAASSNAGVPTPP